MDGMTQEQMLDKMCNFAKKLKTMKRILMMFLFATLAVGCGHSQNKSTSKNTAQEEISSNISTVGIEKFTEIIRQKDVLLIDVRTPKEYGEGHIYGAENIDVNASDFAERIKKIEGKVAVYCRSGKRSMKAAEQLAAQGCTVYNLRGGMLAWSKDWWTVEKQ
jgi:rhodanese-related sulfurtransferase